MRKGSWLLLSLWFRRLRHTCNLCFRNQVFFIWFSSIIFRTLVGVDNILNSIFHLLNSWLFSSFAPYLGTCRYVFPFSAFRDDLIWLHDTVFLWTTAPEKRHHNEIRRENNQGTDKTYENLWSNIQYINGLITSLLLCMYNYWYITLEDISKHNSIQVRHANLL